jgi:hypothetical protein
MHIEAIDHISKREDEKYSEFIERVSENDISIKVKVADIENNTRHDRIEKLDVVVVNRMMRKYERALDVLSDF